jgi:hypothetical protein
MLFYLRTDDLDFQWYDKITGQRSTWMCTRKPDSFTQSRSMCQTEKEILQEKKNILSVLIRCRIKR